MNRLTARTLSIKHSSANPGIRASSGEGATNRLRILTLPLRLPSNRLSAVILARLWRLEGLVRSASNSVSKKASASADRFMDFVARDTVTLDIEDSELRFMVVKRSKVRAWGSAPLEQGTVKDGLVLNPQALTAVLRELMSSGRLKKGPVVASLSGFQSVHRIIELPKMSKKLLGEAVLSEAKRTMPVSLDQLYLSWQTLSEDRGVRRILLLGTPKNLVDAQFKCLKKAGFRPRAMNLKPMALARMVSHRDALIIDMEPESCEIIIMTDGIPAIMRSIRIQTDSGPMDWTQSVMEEFERTLRFFESNYPNATLSQDTPLFLTGKLAGEQDLSEAVSAGAGFNVQPLARNLHCHPDLPLHQYAVNIGLALRESPGRGAAHRNRLPASDMDVLPPEYRLRRLTSKHGLMASGVVMGVALAIPMYQVADTANMKARRLSLEYSALEQSSIVRRVRIKEARDLEQAIATVETKNAALTKILQDYQQMAVQRQRAFESLQEPVTLTPQGVLPEGAILQMVSLSPGKLALKGTAPSYEVALQYADALRKVEGFSNVQVNSVGISNDLLDTVSFDISLQFK